MAIKQRKPFLTFSQQIQNLEVNISQVPLLKILLLSMNLTKNYVLLFSPISVILNRKCVLSFPIISAAFIQKTKPHILIQQIITTAGKMLMALQNWLIY